MTNTSQHSPRYDSYHHHKTSRPCHHMHPDHPQHPCQTTQPTLVPCPLHHPLAPRRCPRAPPPISEPVTHPLMPTPLPAMNHVIIAWCPRPSKKPSPDPRRGEPPPHLQRTITPSRHPAPPPLPSVNKHSNNKSSNNNSKYNTNNRKSTTYDESSSKSCYN